MTNTAKLIDRFPCGIVEIPPSKSIAHRALLCAALAGGGNITNLPSSLDIQATKRCIAVLAQNGVKRFDCGESGTTLRLLIPISLVKGGQNIFHGQGRLLQRPMEPYLEALQVNGALCRFVEDTLQVTGTLQAGDYRLPGNISSQFVSGLLLALPLLAGDSTISLTSSLQSSPYVDITIGIMKQFGVTIGNNGYRKFEIRGRQQYRPAELFVEGDYSQAAFFLVAGALGAPCTCRGLTAESLQGDRRILELLRKSGAQIVTGQDGSLSAHADHLRAQVVDVGDIPDLVPPLAALFCFCQGTSRIVNAARLRHKESDRLDSVTAALSALGADISIRGDDLLITGKETIHGGRVDSMNDHRIAMMCATTALRAQGSVWITGSECVAKSYPAFWNDFCRIPCTIRGDE